MFLLALAVRGAHLASAATGPAFWTPVVDSETFDRLARGFAAGDGITGEYFWQAFFYPYWLSWVYRIAGPSLLLVKLLQAALGAATCVLALRLGNTVFERPAGLVAGILLALYGPAIFFDGELLATGWAAFWSVALILLALRVERAPDTRSAALLGLTAALSVLTRPTFLPVVVVCGGWLGLRLWRKNGARRALVALGSALIAFGLVALPVAVTARDLAGTGGLLPRSGALNLYIGNNPQSDRTITIRPGWDWLELTNLPGDHGVTDARQAPAFFRARALEYVRSDPLGFARGLLSKTMQFFSSRELARNIDVYVFRQWSLPLRALVWKLGPFGFPFGVLLPLAALGLVLGRKRLPFPLLAFTALYPAAVILVFASARYRAPVVPVLAVIAGGGCVALWRALREKRYLRSGVALGIAAILTVASTIAGPFPQERPDYEAELHYFLGTRALDADDLERAGDHLRRAVERDPDHADAHNQLGQVYVRQRRLEVATRHLERAVTANPRSLIAHANLGRVLAARGLYADSIAQFRVGLARAPANFALNYHLGLTLERIGRLDEAARHLDVAARVRPDDPRARQALARIEGRRTGP